MAKQTLVLLPCSRKFDAITKRSAKAVIRAGIAAAMAKVTPQWVQWVRGAVGLEDLIRAPYVDCVQK